MIEDVKALTAGLTGADADRTVVLIEGGAGGGGRAVRGKVWAHTCSGRKTHKTYHKI